MKNKVKIIIILIFLFVGVIILQFRKQNNLSPNILLISLDALRSDHLGCYGYSRNTSPNIDQLAKEGVLFTEAFAQTSWTNGSLGSLFTSTYPSTHKIDDFGDVLDKKLLTLAEVLQKENYSTACASGGDVIYKEFPGVGRGFENFFFDTNIEGVCKLFKAWIEKNKKLKFFVWLHFFDYPHSPYVPPAPYNKLFTSKKPPHNVPICKGMKENDNSRECIPNFIAINNITDAEYYISQYDGEIAYADRKIGEILNELKKFNLYKNTLVIILSDHGESLGEHGYYFQHAFNLYDQLLKIPLIVKGPMIPKGKIINKQIQEIDIMPTILDYLKIKINNQMEGISFISNILNKSKSDRNNIYTFGEIGSDGHSLKSIRGQEWKLIYDLTDNSYELYNLKIDPKETNNLSEKAEKQFKVLKENLEKWENRSKLEIVPVNQPLDEQTKERLRFLGYLQ